MEKLDITSLKNAVIRLDEGILRYQSDITDLQIRDGLIQCFEFTYELNHKMLKRYLELISPNPMEFDAMTFQDLIRSGNEKGLLPGDRADWKVDLVDWASANENFRQIILRQYVAIQPKSLSQLIDRTP